MGSGRWSGAWRPRPGMPGPIPRKRLKELMQRKDGPAIRDTLIWFAALGVTGGLGWYFWGTWWAVPVLRRLWRALRLGLAIRAGMNAATAPRSGRRWMNDVVYQIACFMVMREPTVWRWSHTRHHTDTIIVGRDPEIAVPRPADLRVAIASQSPGHRERGQPLRQDRSSTADRQARAPRRRPSSRSRSAARSTSSARIWSSSIACRHRAAVDLEQRSCR